MRNFLALSMAVLIFLGGCSAFSGSRRMDMTPFADNTRMLFAEAVKINQRFNYKYLEKYTTIPEFEETNRLAEPVLLAFKNIVFYSNQVVAINNAKLSEQDKCRFLADYLKEQIEISMTRHRPDTLQIDMERAEKVLEEVRNSKTFLDGIAASEPIVNGVVAAVFEGIDLVQDQIPIIVAGLNREIDKDFAGPKKNYIRLLELQDQLILQVTRIYMIRIGQMDELEMLLEENTSLRDIIPSPGKATRQNLAEAEAFLTGQLREVRAMLEQLEGIKMEYFAKQDEISAWRADIGNKIMIARTAISIWANAHKNLGKGIPVPPMIDVGGIAGSLAGKAADTVIP